MESSSARATRYAEVQGTVLAYEIERLKMEFPPIMPSLSAVTDANHAVRFEEDREQAIDLFRTT